MEKQEIIKKLQEERERYRLGGGPEKIEAQHKVGKLTARERLELLFDPGTFYELELWALPLRTGFEEIDRIFFPGDAIIVGFGKIQGRYVFVSAPDYTQLAATQGSVHRSKQGVIMDMATKMQTPFVSIIDSAGLRLQDVHGASFHRPPVWGHAEGPIGSQMYSPPWDSGVVPQISLMLGAQIAGTAYSPIMQDFIIMRKSPEVYMTLITPPVIKEVTGEEVSYQELGGAMVHAEKTGLCDIIVETEEEAIAKTRELLSFLPSNYKEPPPFVDTGDPAYRREERLLDIAFQEERNMYEIIKSILDGGHFLELKGLFARSVIIGFAHLNGQTVGIIANNPQVKCGAIDINTSDKAARFIRFCDAFNIPLLFLVDSVGFLPDLNEERSGLLRHAAKLPYAICEATVPKITIYVGNCSGWAEFAMGTEAMGVDLVLAWPSAKIGQIDPEVAVNRIYKKELEVAEVPEGIRQERIRQFTEKFNTIYHVGARQLIQDIIDPRDTRPIIINAFSCFKNKREVHPWKKHGNNPF